MEEISGRVNDSKQQRHMAFDIQKKIIVAYLFRKTWVLGGSPVEGNLGNMVLASGST